MQKTDFGRMSSPRYVETRSRHDDFCKDLEKEETEWLKQLAQIQDFAYKAARLVMVLSFFAGGEDHITF